ncbi:MAG: hypothetical protein H6743_03930 [Rickettsiaceae bacterium]|nr:hypothetical protein [Rickettsiaceae bacterium]
MTKILLDVSYTTRQKYWLDSYIKNKVFNIDDNHFDQEIKKILEENDYVQLAKNAKPTTNVYIDAKDGTPKVVGYIYKVRQEIDGKKINFDAWVTISKITDYPIIELV